MATKTSKTLVRIGDALRDNDPRTRTPFPRVLRVVELTSDGYVRAVPVVAGILQPKHSTRIRLDRIHSDGKPRRSGFSLVPGNPPVIL